MLNQRRLKATVGLMFLLTKTQSLHQPELRLTSLNWQKKSFIHFIVYICAHIFLLGVVSAWLWTRVGPITSEETDLRRGQHTKEIHTALCPSCPGHPITCRLPRESPWNQRGPHLTSRGVTVLKIYGSVCISVVGWRFGMISAQQK